MVGWLFRKSFLIQSSGWLGPWNPPAPASGALELPDLWHPAGFQENSTKVMLIVNNRSSKAHRSGWHIVLCSPIRMFSWLYGSFTLLQSGKHAVCFAHMGQLGWEYGWWRAEMGVQDGEGQGGENRMARGRDGSMDGEGQGWSGKAMKSELEI